ncbi:MAG: FAD-binding protein, partial [Clostridia bacterium]|nr:FAD-binding protein [Clostridia bacterium]
MKLRGGFPGPILSVPALVVGSGAAGLNSALSLARSRGADFVLLVTEGMNMGTSRNTGSDKQTYYKQATGANTPDSPRAMAEDYFACGAMHGDLALTEALGSLRGFFRLVSLGVPFPADRWGEYTGYRTDHDPHRRATSCGPLTSKKMTEALEAAVRREGVPILDGVRVFRVLTDGGRAAGIVGVSEAEVSPDNPAGLVAVLAGAVVWATGGPSSVYAASVYPESQTCGLGAPLLAGASASNLTESQYGIASAAFRWNLSGSYQQVLPRYLSLSPDGEAREFLPDAFGDAKTALSAQFRKGYEWPFDPSKIGGTSRSSEVDLAVYREIRAGRRVFLDFRANPDLIERAGLTPDTVGAEAYEYLEKSRALGETPIRRLRQMNEKAYALYLS